MIEQDHQSGKLPPQPAISDRLIYDFAIRVGKKFLLQRQTIANRRLLHRRQAA
jgi:hypothetical protein